VARWGERRLRDTVVTTTVHYINVMLASPKLRSITSERTLLKNLGAWLGKLTLAQNKPVLQVGGLRELLAGIVARPVGHTTRHCMSRARCCHAASRAR
jgi:hypothetical protein